MINNCCNLQRVAAQLPLEFIGGLEGIAVYDQRHHIIGIWKGGDQCTHDKLILLNPSMAC